MIYTFHADATIRNKSGNALAQVRTKKGKAWTPKKTAKTILKFAALTPFRDEADAFSILVQHKKRKENIESMN